MTEFQFWFYAYAIFAGCFSFCMIILDENTFPNGFLRFLLACVAGYFGFIVWPLCFGWDRYQKNHNNPRAANDSNNPAGSGPNTSPLTDIPADNDSSPTPAANDYE